MAPGRAGKSHCGKWTTRIPKGVWATRLVCTLPPGHKGKHYSRWTKHHWPQEVTDGR